MDVTLNNSAYYECALHKIIKAILTFFKAKKIPNWLALDS